MNTLTIYQLIAAKQSSSATRLWKDIGLTLAILTLLLVSIQFIEPITSNHQYAGFALAMFIVAVIEMGSHSFSEFKKAKVAYQWLTLPATTTEKWMSNFVTSLIIVPVIFLLVLTVATLLTNVFLFVFGWGQLLPIFNPFSATGVLLLKVYIGFHPLMFFAAIYFKKRPILKAFGALSVIFLALVMYFGFIGNLLFSGIEDQIPHMQGEWTENSVVTIGNWLRITEDGPVFENVGMLKFIANIINVSYFIFFWGLSYLRLKELEL